MDHPPVFNINDAELEEQSHGTSFEARFASIASRIGARKLGCRVVELQPGKRAWPYHFHHVNEELFFVIEGRGSLRYDNKIYPLHVGDVISAPAGPGHAHQIINTSSSLLRYLAISTMEEPEIAEYPDSDKIGVLVGSPPGGDPAERTLSLFTHKDAGVDYWDGEE
jgi:uncharacterized cupin superfamily protein